MLRTNSFSVPQYPGSFLLPNGKKALEIELATEASPKRKKEIRRLLKLPIINTIEQNNFVLPGNGVSLHFKDTGEKVFCVLDGTHFVKKHDLPKGTNIVLAASELGRNLIGKKTGEHGELDDRGKTRPFIVEFIQTPSRSKWPFKFPFSFNQ